MCFFPPFRKKKKFCNTLAPTIRRMPRRFRMGYRQIGTKHQNTYVKLQKENKRNQALSHRQGFNQYNNDSLLSAFISKT